MIVKSKIQNPKSKINPKSQISKYKFSHLLSVICFSLFIFHFSLFTNSLRAGEITILYTGETHAMLYPCACPNEPDGGVARRGTLIKQLRKNNPNTLVLDSGGFFAGGVMDEYTQNTPLDRQRTEVHLKAMELMGYDALTLGDDEFNFGSNFLLENIDKTDLVFLSSNMKSDPESSISSGDLSGSRSYSSQNSNIRDKVLPYIIKEFGDTKIGIVGVTNISARQKAQDIEFTNPEAAVGRIVGELKKKVDIIILLSHLGEQEDLSLIKEIAGIDIVIVGHSRSQQAPYTKIGSTLLLRPSWQGRRLGKLTLTIAQKKITNYKVEELRLSDKISDDPDILSILPGCFSDNNCKKEGMLGNCRHAGTLESDCVFTEASKVSLLVITSRRCSVCDSERIERYLKTQLPGLVISYLYHPDVEAIRLIRDLNIKTLPVYLLGKEIERENGFDKLRENLEIKGSFYMLKPQFSGISYFPNRKEIKGKSDLFISLYDKDAPGLLEIIRQIRTEGKKGKFNPGIHFLATEEEGKFDAAKGTTEIDEYLRSICIQRYYPNIFWQYISCRAKNINSSWWDDCLDKVGTDKIKSCAQGKEGRALLKENISLNKELEIMFGPTYLLDNQEIFSLQGVPTKEEFKKIIKR